MATAAQSPDSIAVLSSTTVDFFLGPASASAALGCRATEGACGADCACCACTNRSCILCGLFSLSIAVISSSGIMLLVSSDSLVSALSSRIGSGLTNCVVLPRIIAGFIAPVSLLLGCFNIPTGLFGCCCPCACACTCCLASVLAKFRAATRLFSATFRSCICCKTSNNSSSPPANASIMSSALATSSGALFCSKSITVALNSSLCFTFSRSMSINSSSLPRNASIISSALGISSGAPFCSKLSTSRRSSCGVRGFKRA
mmetsp:Transcript_22718/g.34971  ORF Transcript_22718/g.34971 Transcript_22718/m.34971 type:complete len:259 (+) Transcript_22718:722-1498(+)